MISAATQKISSVFTMTEKDGRQGPIHKQEAEELKASHLPRHRLDFNKIKHCGRKEQLQTLHNLYQKAAVECQSSAVILQAESGTGKSALLETFMEDLRRQTRQKHNLPVVNSFEHLNAQDTISSPLNQQRILFGFGKFEERTAASEPFAAIVDVVNDVIDTIILNEDDTLSSSSEREQDQALYSRLEKSISTDELNILIGVIANLRKLQERDNRRQLARKQSQIRSSEKSSDSTMTSKRAIMIISSSLSRDSSKHSTSSSHHGPGVQQQQQQQHQQQHQQEESIDLLSTSRASSKRQLSDEDGSNDEENVKLEEDSLQFEAFGDMAEKEWRFERFRIAFRELIRCISRHEPLVLIWDDMHFADRDSITLMKTIIEDPSKDLKLLFVGATRPIANGSAIVTITGDNHDMDASFSAHSTGSELASLRNLINPTTMHDSFIMNQHQSRLYQMSLPSLSLSDIKSMLSELLGLSSSTSTNATATSSSSIEKLAELIRDKTGGNAFVVMHFIRQLERDGLVYCCHEEIDSESNVPQWDWDIERIDKEMESSESVEDLIVENLNALDDDQRQLLITAASFGVSHFELSTIVHAMDVLNRQLLDRHADDLQEEAKEDDDGDDLYLSAADAEYTDHFKVRASMVNTRDVLDLSVQNGFVEELSPGHFKFSHDRIREAAYSLLPKGRARKEVHLKIARQLRLWMDTEEEYGTTLSDDSMLLHTAKQYNYGADLITDTWERLDIAELNFHAAEVAARKSSFFPAMEYLEHGIVVLGPRAWKEHYDLTLKLKTAYTRMQYSCGLFDNCIVSANDVIANTGSFHEKRNVFHTKLLCLLQQERINEGIALSRSILENLGYPLPKRLLPLYVMKEYMKASSFLKGISDDEIRNLPEFDDENLEDSINILSRMGEFSFFGGPFIYLYVYIVRTLAIMKEHGAHPVVTPMGMVAWAWFLVMDNKFDEALRFGKLSLELVDRQCKGRYRWLGARTKLSYYYYVLCWKEPIQPSVKPLQESLAEIFACGAMDTYHQDVSVILRQKFSCGYPLGDVADNCSKVLEVLRDYRQPLHWNINAPIAQAVLNLMGKSMDPTVLSGEIMDANKCLISWKKSNNKAAIYQYHFFTIILKYHFSDYQGAAKVQKQMRRDLFEDGPEFFIPVRLFYTGLINLALFRQTRKRKYKSRAIPVISKLSRWVELGACACEYQKLLLEAELVACQSSMGASRDAVHLYNQAIDAAARTGIRHHEALANELACKFLSNHSATRRASSYLSRALHLYSEWQAHAKVQELISRNSELMDLMSSPFHA